MVTVATLKWQDVMTGTFPDTPARKAFREAVTHRGPQREGGPPESNGRIEKAVTFVLMVILTMHPRWLGRGRQCP